MEFHFPIDDEFLCGICHKPWEKPLMGKTCQHVFCGDCINDMLLKNSHCPSCKTGLTPSELVTIHPSLASMADKIVKVYCPNRRSTPPCEVLLQRSQFEAHVNSCKAKPRRSSFQYVDEGSIHKDLICGICHDPFQDPTETVECRHVFCTTCITDCLAKSKLCPLCNTVIAEKTMQPSRALTSMLSDLVVKCELAGCTWKGARESYGTHRAQPHPTAAPAKAVTFVEPDKKAMQLETINEFNLVKDNHCTNLISMAHINAPVKLDSEKRAPINISAVIDVSGSMAGEKLTLVKQCLEFVVGELTAEDKLGIVAFDDHVEERLNLTSVNEAGKAKALAAIRGLKQRGSTNLSGGLFAGIDQVSGKSLELHSKHVEPDMFSSSMPAAVTNTLKPSNLLKSVHNVLAKSFTRARTFEVGTKFNVKIASSHLYTSMKRDKTVSHNYELVVKLPTFAIRAVNNSVVTEVRVNLPTGTVSLVPGTIKAENKFEFVSSAVVPSIDIVVKFHPDFHFPDTVLTHKFTTAEGNSEITVDLESRESSTSPARATTPPAKESKSLNYVWLFTDGEANVGIQDPATLTRETRERLKVSQVSSIFTFGFGASHNADLLKSLAETSQGSYYFIRTESLIKEVFANCLGGLLSVVAQTITLEVSPAAGVTIIKVLSTLPFTTTSSGSRVVTMKDLYSEEQRDVLVEVAVNAPVGERASMGLVSWKLTWSEPSTGASKTIEKATNVQVVAFLPPGLKADESVDEQRNRILATIALEEARKDADNGNFSEAKEKVKKSISMVKASTSAAKPVSMAMETDLMSAMTKMESESRWASEGTKVVSQMCNMHGMQRSNALEGCDRYATSSKATMMTKIKK